MVFVILVRVLLFVLLSVWIGNIEVSGVILVIFKLLLVVVVVILVMWVLCLFLLFGFVFLFIKL